MKDFQIPGGIIIAEVICAFPEDLYSALTARGVLFRIVKQCDGQTVRLSLSGRDFPKLEKLMNKRDELRKKELMKEIEDSGKSFDEIIKFLREDSAKGDAANVES